MGKPRHPKPDGITIRCVSCKTTEGLSWQEAHDLKDLPFCKKCGMPAVAVKGHWRQGT